MGNTLQEIRDSVYFKLSEKETSKTYTLARVDQKINSVIEDICTGEYINALNQQVIKGGDMRFLKKKLQLTLETAQASTADINIGDVQIQVDTDKFTTSGYVNINGDVVQYAGKTPTALTGVTGIDGNFDSGTRVAQIFEVPMDADRTFQLFQVNPNGEMIEVEYKDDKFADYRYYYFSILWDNASDDKYFVYINRTGRYNYGYGIIQDRTKYWLEYFIKCSTLVDPTDETELPLDTGVKVVALIVAGELLLETEEAEQSQRLLTLGYSKLIMFYDKYKEFHKMFRKKGIRKGPQYSY